MLSRRLVLLASLVLLALLVMPRGVTAGPEELDPDDVIEYQLKPGAHGLVGVKLKPPVVPFSVSAEARYTVKSEGDFEEPGSHLSVYVGAALGF